MSMKSQFQTDPELEVKGVVVPYSDFRITVARAGGANKKYAKLLEAKTKIHRRAIQTDTMDKEVAAEILREVYVGSIILNWEVLVDRDTQEYVQGIENLNGVEPLEGGEPLPFTQENVLQTLRDMEDLFIDLQQQSQRIVLFQRMVLEDDAGN